MQTASHRPFAQWVLIKFLLFAGLETEMNETQFLWWRNIESCEDRREAASAQSFLALLHCDFPLDFGWPERNEAAP